MKTVDIKARSTIAGHLHLSPRTGHYDSKCAGRYSEARFKIDDVGVNIVAMGDHEYIVYIDMTRPNIKVFGNVVAVLTKFESVYQGDDVITREAIVEAVYNLFEYTDKAVVLPDAFYNPENWIVSDKPVAIAKFYYGVFNLQGIDLKLTMNASPDIVRNFSNKLLYYTGPYSERCAGWNFLGLRHVLEILNEMYYPNFDANAWEFVSVNSVVADQLHKSPQPITVAKVDKSVTGSLFDVYALHPKLVSSGISSTYKLSLRKAMICNSYKVSGDLENGVMLITIGGK